MASTRKPFQFRLRTVLAAIAACSLILAPTGYFVRARLRQGRSSLVPVSGVVTFNGQPLADARVTFFNQDPQGKHAFGGTDAHGAFQLYTFRLPSIMIDGAEPGEYMVAVEKDVEVEGRPVETDEEWWQASFYDEQSDRLRLAAKKRVTPWRFCDPAASGLRATVVTGGTNVFTFNLAD